MEEELLNSAKEIDNLPKTGRNIRKRKKLIGELGAKYIKNLKKLKFTEDEHNIIQNIISKYEGEYDEAMENSIKSYFDTIYINCQYEFYNKSKGVQAGKIAKIIDSKNNITFYYVKTHQHGGTSISTKQPLDIKELFIYKLLESLGIGSEVHWFEPEIFENSIYIATKGLNSNNINQDKEVVKLDVITRILTLDDVMSNKTNILQHDDKKGYIIDFRIQKITRLSNAYIYNKVYESFLNGNTSINYSYDEYFEQVMSPANNENKIKWLEEIINTELIDFKKKVDNAYEKIKDDNLIKRYDNADLLCYIGNIKENYDSISKMGK